MSRPMSQFYALIIGVGTYSSSDFPDLPVTVSDARRLASILTDAKFCGYAPENVVPLIGDDATLENVRAGLTWLAHQARTNSTVIIYFSGHGGRQFDGGAWRTYLCPREVELDDLARTALSGDEFSTALTRITAGRLLVILDACYAASSAELKGSLDVPVWKAGLADTYYDALSRGSGRIVMASSKEDQVSFVRAQGDFSLFTYHLDGALRGGAAVRGDGFIHVLDVFHYVSESVQRDNPHQVPILKAHNLDMNFPVALDRQSRRDGAISSLPTVVAIRERIIQDPTSGAQALSDYLTTLPDGRSKRAEVDLKRTELYQVERERDLLGDTETRRATRAAIVFFLLRICHEIEEGSG